MSQFSPTQIEELSTIGSYLRQQREQRSLTIEAVAEGTFVRQPLLEAIEAGNSDLLPEIVYVQGFIRRYGDFLGLDGKELAHSLSRDPGLGGEKLTPKIIAPPLDTERQESPAAAAREQMGKSPKKTRSSEAIPLNSSNQSNFASKLTYYWAYLLAVGVAIAGLYTFFLRPNSAPVATSPPTDSLPLSVPEPRQSPASPPSPAPSPAPSRDKAIEVQAALSGDAWLKVEADGKKVYEGILVKGERRTWIAQKSLNIRSGNAGAVNLSVNQRPSKPLGKLGKIVEITLTPDSTSF